MCDDTPLPSFRNEAVVPTSSKEVRIQIHDCSCKFSPKDYGDYVDVAS